MTLLHTEDFLSQTGRITMEVAKLLLGYSKGEKLPRMMDLARKLKSGNGTIQEAFNYLVKLGAISVEARGAQGSHLLDIDYTLLWRYAGNDWIIGSMPLPYTLRYEGLATALYAQLEASGLPFNMTYQRGSLSRGDMVRKGHYHYAIMSLLAAEHFVSRYSEVTIVGQLPTGSYVDEHILISRVPREQIRRVGVDFSSLDEVLLVEDEFATQPNLEKVPITHAQVLDLLQEERFDAIIWNREGIRVTPDTVRLLPLQGSAHKREIATQAAVIARQDALVHNVLLRIFSSEDITRIQRDVFHRQRLPLY